MAISFIPSRSVLSGGLSGIFVWAICLALQYYGVPVTEEQVTIAVTVIGAIVTQIVPDSIKDHAKALNVKVEDIASIIPTTFNQYPTGKNGVQDQPVQSNQDWKKNGNTP